MVIFVIAWPFFFVLLCLFGAPVTFSIHPVGILVTLCSIVNWQSTYVRMRDYYTYIIVDNIASVLLPSFKMAVKILVDLTDLGCTYCGTY